MHFRHCSLRRWTSIDKENTLRRDQTRYMTSPIERTKAMKTWPVQDAKARFSELLDTCLREGPQMVTKRGAEAAVLMPMDAWRRLQHAARPTLKELLLADGPRMEIPLARRGRKRRRAPAKLA